MFRSGILKSGLLFFVFMTPLLAQKMDKAIQELESDFQAFKYQQVINKGRFLLADPFTTHQDSLLIYQYMLNAAYSIPDTVLAKNLIQEIYQMDATFHLDPQKTSPKIIEFYNLVVQQLKQKNPPRHEPVITSPTVVLSEPPFKAVLSTIALPGSGHFFLQQNNKGIWYTGISSLLLSAIAFTIYKTEQYQDDYLSAPPGASFDELYGNYNRMYKTRNSLLGAYVLWTLFCLHDLFQMDLSTSKSVYIQPTNQGQLALRIFW